MSTSHKYHIAIRRIAIIVAAINLVSCFMLDLREWLVYFDPWIVIAVVCPAFAIGLPSLPYLLPVAQRAQTSIATILSLVLVTLVLCFFETLWFLMIAIAEFCRGPDWNFYWPWEERVPKIVALNNINLSEWVWIYHLDQPLPANPFMREWVGMALVVLHLLIVPLVVCWLLRRFAVQAQFWRMLTFVMVLQLLAAFSGKMILRWFFNLKYVVAFPEQFVNI